MKHLLTVTKFELLRYFTSPLAYVYLIAFLLLNSSFAIYFGGFFGRGQADLSSMFAYHPWLYLLFLSGISMRLWSEEFRSKTIIQIITMPISVSALVFGKYLASIIFCTIALALTFPLWITVNILGEPNNAIIFLSYLGSLTLAACMLAISQTMSALTKNQVIALVLAVIANLIFFLSGMEYVLSLFRLFMPLFIVDLIASFSFLTHFNNIIQGLVELRDIIFFASIIILFNLTTIIIISFKTSGTSKLLKSTGRAYYVLTFVAFLLGFIGINLIANSITRSIQFDLTIEKVFTLSNISKRTVQNLNRNLHAKFFYSRDLEQRNPDIRQMSDKVRITLQELEKLSRSSQYKFTFSILTPTPMDDLEEEAYANNLQPVPIIDINKNAFFGLVIQDEIDNKNVVPFFSLERSEFIEQDIIESIFSLNQTKRKNVGIITYLPVFEAMLDNNRITQDWTILSYIRKFYNVRNITKPEDIKNVDVLMLIHPMLTEEMEQAIKTYTKNQGKLLILLDVAAEAPRIFSATNPELIPSHIGDGSLEDLWGFDFQRNVVIGDLENSITIDASIDYDKNLIFTQDILQFIIKENGLNLKAEETKHLHKILFASATAVTSNNPDISFIPLISTSNNSAFLPVEVVYKNYHPNFVLSKFQKDDKEKTIAARLHNPTTKSDVIVVADTDFIYNTFWGVNRTIMDKNYTIPLFDNVNFILNSLDSLTNQTGLNEIRGKTRQSRPFEGLEKLRRENQRQFRVKENDILDKIAFTQQALKEVSNKKVFEEREAFTPDELSLISKLRKNLNAQRQELNILRNSQNQNLKNVEFAVKFLNIYAVPCAILLALLLAYLIKNSAQALKQPSFTLNRQAINIIIASIILLGIGIILNKQESSNKIDELKGQLVFQDLAEKGNDITQIRIKNNQTELNLYKENNIWKLKGFEAFPVYQERITNFINSILSAEFFEKKSNNLEYLSRFNLSPIQSTLIELKDSNKNNLAAFEVGKYDIDLGRGSIGAYIKFPNQYQAWLAHIELVDLSLDWNNWTYSHLWNLRFGRFLSINGKNDADFITGLAKVLLNTTLSNPEKAKGLKPSFSIDVISEGENKTKINFYSDNDKYYVSFVFINIDNNDRLEFFASHAKGLMFEINKKNWEAIKNASK